MTSGAALCGGPLRKALFWGFCIIFVKFRINYFKIHFLDIWFSLQFS